MIDDMPKAIATSILCLSQLMHLGGVNASHTYYVVFFFVLHLIATHYDHTPSPQRKEFSRGDFVLRIISPLEGISGGPCPEIAPSRSLWERPGPSIHIYIDKHMWQSAC